jgi:Integrase core domain
MWFRQNASNLQGGEMRYLDHSVGTELLIEAGGPEMLIVRGLQQCHGDLDLVSGSTDAALQHIANVDTRSGAEWRLSAITGSGVNAKDTHVLETDQPLGHDAELHLPAPTTRQWRHRAVLSDPQGAGIWGKTFRTAAEVRAAVSDFVARYNAAWRLERLGYLSPLDYRARHLQPESHAA